MFPVMCTPTLIHVFKSHALLGSGFLIVGYGTIGSRDFWAPRWCSLLGIAHLPMEAFFEVTLGQIPALTVMRACTSSSNYYMSLQGSIFSYRTNPATAPSKWHEPMWCLDALNFLQSCPCSWQLKQKLYIFNALGPQLRISSIKIVSYGYSLSCF